MSLGGTLLVPHGSLFPPTAATCRVTTAAPGIAHDKREIGDTVFGW